jgi:hypothetical protein
VNYDETRLILNSNGKLQLKRLVSKTKNKPQSRLTVPTVHCGTFIPFVAANGSFICSYFVFSTKFNEEEQANVKMYVPTTLRFTRNSNFPTKVFWSDSGYVNHEIWDQIVDSFIEFWVSQHPGLHCCLIGDNLGVHRALEPMKKAMDHQIFQTFFVPNTSHWSQPLDNLLFARLKQEIQ